MSQHNAISGLGIDMGTPSSMASGNSDYGGSISRESRHRPKQQQQQQQRPRSMQLPESLNQYNDRRRTVASERQAADQRTRVVSGRTSKLEQAVAALDKNQSWDTQSIATSSDFYGSDTSPQTDSSATTHSSGYRSSGSNSLKRTQTVRKQVSQPNMVRASMMAARLDADVEPQRQTFNGQQERQRNVLRSKSSMSLSSHYHEDAQQSAGASLTRAGVGSRSLGRSAEIPRSGSRGGAMMRSRTMESDPHRQDIAARQPTWDPRATLDQTDAEGEARRGSNGKILIPDGFGGFIEAPDQTIAAENKVDAREQREAVNPRTSMQSAHEPRLSQQPARPQSRQEHQNKPATTMGRPRSHTIGDRPASSLRVGSFYGPNGEERARVDTSLAHSQSGHGAHRDSISHDSANGVSEAGSNTSSNASSQRSAGPRLRFMASPNTASNERARAGSSVVSSSSGISTSIADGDVKTLMRSVSGFRGLLGAEHGETMVSYDAMQRMSGSGFDDGEAILPGKTRGEDDESILQSALLSQKRDSVATIDRTFQSLSLSEHHKQHQRPLNAPPRHVRQASAPAGMIAQAESMTRSTSAAALERHGTLIAAHANPARRSRDLSRLLANSNGKLPASSSSDASTVVTSVASYASMSNKQSNPNALPHAVLEQGKTSKSRVDVDLVLESELVVEGGVLSGRLEIKVRKNTTREGHLMLCQPKVRVVGFEELVNDDTRHIFYHYATVIDGSPRVGNAPNRPYVLHGSPNLSSPELENRRPLACFASTPDNEGYSVAKEGSHSIPFSLELPVGKGAKGSYRGKHAVVRYIVIGSVKLKNANGTNHSIAHFYRHIDIFPYLNPALVLSTSPKPLIARASKGLFLGGPNKVHLQASLHRNSWIAGQRLYVHLRIDNQTNKKVKSLALALVRTVVLYRPRPELDLAMKASGTFDNEAYIDPDACTTSTSRKKISEDILELGQKGAKGTVTAKGWWTGVEPGDSVEFAHNVKLPADALTISRGRHVEVVYSLKVSVGSSLSSDVSVELPVRIVNFVSLDPPPLKSGLKAMNIIPACDTEEPMIERVRCMDALKSPQVGSPNPTSNDGRYLNVARHVEGVQRNNGSRNTLQVEDEETAQLKRLQHQKSLDFINHAIRSATARRVSPSNGPSPTGLGIDVDQGRTPLAGSSASSTSGDDVSSVSGSEAVHPSCRPYQHRKNPPIVALSGVEGGARAIYMPSHSVSVDDADYDDEDDFDVGEQTINLNDESVADIDMVIGSAQVDGGESSPEFQQRRGMDNFGGDMTVNSEEDGDMSGMTVTSNDACDHANEIDEFDEEEERIERLHRHIDARRHAISDPDHEDDGGPTPLAKSPPKFQAQLAYHDPYNGTSDCASDSEASSIGSSSSSIYSAAAIREAQREGKTIVRTRSDLEQQLGRSSTIIRGPSSNGSRPVSPSKMAPSPTKSALKRSTTSSVISEPSSTAASSVFMRNTAPLQFRAKIANDGGRGQIQQTRPVLRQTGSGNSDVDSYSDSSVSPATSASVSTPREGMSDSESSTYHDKESAQASTLNQGLGLRLEPVIQDVRVNVNANAYFSPNALSPKSKGGAMPSSTSMGRLAPPPGVNTAVPSVRDKIAMLENRKRALQELTGGGGAQSTASSTPPRNVAPPVPAKSETPSPSRLTRPSVGAKQSADTPNRVQAAARNFLERNNSIVSETSSVTSSAVQPDYLRNIPSMQNFKAPIFRASGQ